MTWSVGQQISVMHQLVSGGVSQLGAAALVSRWSNVEDRSGLGSTTNSIGAVGIGQWLGSRKENLFNFADETGASPYDVNTQTAFAIHELTSGSDGTNGMALATLNSATDPFTAATGASMFERAEGYNHTTGTDNFTGQTANGIPSILANASGEAVPSGYVSTDSLGSITGDNAADDAALTAQPGDASIPVSSDLSGSFGMNEEDIQAANYSGAAASLSTQTAGNLTGGTVAKPGKGGTVPAAINAQTAQLAANQKAAETTATNIAKSQAATSTGIVANLEAYSSNLFTRGALIVVGVIFILAAVFALAFGGGDLREGFRRVAEGAVTA